MKRFFLFITAIFVLFACKEEELTVVDTASLNDIKISMTTSQTPGLKSAEIQPFIKPGDTVDIQCMEDVNILLSANVNGEPIKGKWYIYLQNVDNDNEYCTLATRPKSEARNSSICAIKPEKLGLYSVNFDPANIGESFHFFIRHKGLPGTVGDSYENDYAFRIEKEIFHTNNGDRKIGYTMYLKYNKEEFNSWSPQNGVDPRDENNFKAILYSGKTDSFTDNCRGLNTGTMFKLKVCEYSEYVCFTFLIDDYPPLGQEYPCYSIQFYSGNFGCDWWTFKTTEISNWSANGIIYFSVMN